MNRTVRLVLLAIGAIVAIGIIATPFASDQPDGLEYVAEQEGFADTAEDHDLGNAPLADYGENLGGNGRSTIMSAIIGLTVTGVVGFGLFWVVRRKDEEPSVTT